MLLILHNLPKEVTSFDIRHLIKEQCGLREVILDNLLDEGPGKRITVGLAEEEDAALLMRKLNGLHYKKCQLYVEDVRKKKLAAPTYPVLIPAGLQPQAPQQQPWFQYPVQKPAETLQANYSNMPYYMTQESNNMNAGNQMQTTQQDTSVFNPYYKYKTNDMLQTLKATNFMTYPLASNTNKAQAPDAPSSFKSYQNDRDNQGDRRDNTTRINWRENKSPPSKRHENFGNFSQRESRLRDKTSTKNKNSEDFRRYPDNNRSPPRERNLFYENKKTDRREAFDSSRRLSRSNQRDKNSYINERPSSIDRNSFSGRQRDREFDQHERRNIQKRNHEQVERISRENVERPERSFGNVFENSTTFSSTPENASFTKTNQSIFNKIIGSRGFGETSNNKIQFPSPKQDTFTPQVSFPNPKRSRFDPPQQYFGNKKYVNPNAPSNKATDFQKMMTRHTNWRIQSATLLAKEVLKNASPNKIERTMFKTVLKKLRECIMSRLDVIMGDNIANNLDEILSGYRTKFSNRDDINFLKAVIEKIERENKEHADEATGSIVGQEKQHQESGKFNKGPIGVNPFYAPSSNVTPLKQQHQFSGKLNKGQSVTNPHSAARAQFKQNLTTPGKQKVSTFQNQPKMPFIKDPKTMPRLPRYPNCDKQGYKQAKKNALLEHEEGFYTMEPEFERAVNEEVEKLVECYVTACEPSSNENENILRNKIITSTADEFKKIIRLNVTKRVLNVTDGLVLRIFSTPKPPPKAAMDEFFKKHGAISLKQSETKKMFLVTCDTYESYDRLLAIETANFGSVTIHIKPFQVLGPATKKNVNANQITLINTTEDFTKDVDELEIDLKSDVNDDADVMLVENEQSEVVVIRDDLDKSINSGNTSDNVDVNNVNEQEINDIKELPSNDKDGDANTVSASKEVTAVIENIIKSNDKDDSNVGVDNNTVKDNILNEKVDDSNTEVNEKNGASRDKAANSQSGDLNTSETKDLDSLDDIFKEADGIMEDDLEDF